MKLVNETELDGALTQVANAIRTKTGKSATMTFPTGMLSEIAGLNSTMDATAVASDIRSGKTAYAGGVKITGTAALVYNSSTEELTMPDWSVTING